MERAPEIVGVSVEFIVSGIEFSGSATAPVVSGTASCSTTLAPDSLGRTMTFVGVGGNFSTVGVDKIFGTVQERRKKEENKRIKNFIIQGKIQK